MTLPAQDIVERLRFHGRYASESQDECTARKNAEREEAAETISRLTADNEALQNDVRIGCANIDREIAARQTAEARAIALEADLAAYRQSSIHPDDYDRLKSALSWAMKQILPYSRRIKGQNEVFCDGYDAARAALGGSDHG